MSRRLDGRSIGAIFIVALAVRLVVFLLIAWRLDLSVEQYARLYDGNSYLVTATALVERAWPEDVYHARVFPGLPALLAAAQSISLSPAWAALAINWMSASIAAALAAVLFRDWRVGLACAVLIPHYLMNSTMAMTEAPLLALTLGGLILARRGANATGGALLGCAGLVRPMACFATAAQMVAMRDWRRAAIFGGMALAVVIAGLFVLQMWMGDALFSYRYQSADPAAYGGRLLEWPFVSLIRTPIEQDVPIARVAYVWAHVVLVLIACVTVIRGHDDRSLRYLAVIWLWSNTLFALSVGNVWGFECFHRFTIPALPAMFHALRPWLPRRMMTWAVIAAASAIVAIYSAGS